MIKVSKYVKLKENIKELIKKDNLKPHDILPSRSQLIDKYNVSAITVRKALDELCAEGVIYRHHGKGTFVAPVKERYLEIYNVMTGFNFEEVTKSIEYTLFPLIIQRLEEELRTNNMEMLLALHNGNEELERQIIDGLPEKNPDGAILYINGFKSNLPYYKKAVDIIKNVVFIDRYIEEFDTNYVVTDNYKSAYDMGDLICEKNVEKIYVICPDWLNNTTIMERKNGFYNAVEKHKDIELIKIEASVPYHIYFMELCNYFKNVFKQNNKKIGILAINSVIISDLYEYFKEDFDALEHWSFACFDKPYGDFSDNVSIVFAKQDLKGIAKQAVRIIAENKKEKQHILVPSEIVVV